MYCEHGRLADGCEDCALIKAMERGYQPHTLPALTQTAPDVADHDLYLNHHDSGRYTFIRAGDPIPTELAHLPREQRTNPTDPPGASTNDTRKRVKTTNTVVT